MNHPNRFFRAFLLALTLTELLSPGRHAVTADDRANCFNLSFAPLDDTIPACDRLIDSGEVDDKELYLALEARAMASYAAETYRSGHTIDSQTLLESQHVDYDRMVEIARRLHAREEAHLPLLQNALAGRAEANARLGRPDRAVQDYSENIGLREQPRMGDFYGRSLSLGHLGQVEAAIEDMSIVIKMSEGDSNLANYFARRAKLYEAAGDTAAAIVDYRRTLTLMPDHTVANKALQRLTATP